MSKIIGSSASSFSGRQAFLKVPYCRKWRFNVFLDYKHITVNVSKHTVEIGGMASGVNCLLQVLPQNYEWIQIWSWTGSIQNTNLLLPQSFLCCFAGMLRIIMFGDLFSASFSLTAWDVCTKDVPQNSWFSGWCRSVQDEEHPRILMLLPRRTTMLQGSFGDGSADLSRQFC